MQLAKSRQFLVLKAVEIQGTGNSSAGQGLGEGQLFLLCILMELFFLHALWFLTFPFTHPSCKAISEAEGIGQQCESVPLEWITDANWALAGTGVDDACGRMGRQELLSHKGPQVLIA